MSINIEMDFFDREYGLSDLLPLKTLGDFFDKLSLEGCEIRISRTDDQTYFETKGFRKKKDSGMNAFTAAIHYDSEHIADLSFYAKEGADAFDFCSFMVLCIEKMMGFQEKILMTSGLHGQIVESSYAELVEKNQMLMESEAKYRNLAENLEVEVEKKAQKIKAAQARLLQAEKLAAIGSLAAGMAHEINNPLGFISSNLKTLCGYVEELTTKKTDQKNIEFIRQDATDILSETVEGLARIQNIVKDLKVFSSIDAPDITPTDINRCIDATVGIMDHLLGSRIKIVRNYGSIPELFVNQGQINQMIMNILMNSVQAIEGEGTITIKTGFFSKDSSRVKIIISDTGPGIKEEHIDKIFDPFFTTKDVGKGMGLGLTNARETARIHGGDMAVRNLPEGGAACIILIPVKAN